MFQSAYQSGSHLELFSTQGKLSLITPIGKDLMSKWKITGGSKVYEKEVKGYVYHLEGNAKMQIPKDDKQNLMIIQPFLVI